MRRWTSIWQRSRLRGRQAILGHRNGHSRKTVLTATSKLDLQVPRDRQASFEPQLIATYRRRLPDSDEKIVSLHASGMTVATSRGNCAGSMAANEAKHSPHLGAR